MNGRRDGWIGLVVRRPVLWLAVGGTALSFASLVNLLIFRFAPTSPRFLTRTIGPAAELFLGPIPMGAAGTAMLIIAIACRHGRPTKARLIGCTLVGSGALTIIVALVNGASGWKVGIVVFATGVVLLLRARPVGNT